MILTALISLLAGAGIALLSVFMVVWARQRGVNTLAAQRKAEERLAWEVLQDLSFLVNRVTGDIESHNDQVADVNHRLATCESVPGIVNDAVRRLLKANKQIQDKLSRTEKQLRDQAVKIESHIVASRTDPLTLLGNRLALEEELHRFMSEFQSHGRCFSLVNIDLDNFRKLNDTHGHAAGDEVLRGLANVLSRCLPKNAFVARLGGEEFAVLLQNSRLFEACAIADAAREAVQTASFHHNGNNVSITASFGVAELHTGEDAASLFHRADQALCLAKDRGHNSVYWHDGENSGEGLPAASTIEAGVVPSQPQESGTRALEPLPAKTETSRPAADDPGICNNLANRTMFCSSVRIRISEWKRGGSPISILLLKVNLRDKSGAIAPGVVPSRILQDVATHIQIAVRAMDMVGYYSPACFCLLIPAVDPLAPEDMTQRIKEQLFHLSTNPDAALDLRIGVATVTEGDDAVSLLKRAENDLLIKEKDRQNGCTTASSWA